MHLLLHIGTEKTGTTVLQDWLYANRAALSSQGIYLSSELGISNNRLLVSFFQKNFDEWMRARRIFTADDKLKFFSGFKERFTEEIHRASATHDVMIITSEHFHSRLQNLDSIVELKTFLDGLFESVRVSCYFREQADLALSRYSTTLKGEGVVGLDTFLGWVAPDHYYYNCMKIADNWSDIFGRVNCDFRIYEKRRFKGGDIRVDFISAIPKTLDPNTLDFTVKALANERLSEVEALFYRVINERISYRENENYAVDHHNVLLKNLISGVGKPAKIFSIEGRFEQIRKQFAHSNREFFDTYFDGQTSFNNAEVAACAPRPISEVIDDYVGPLISHASELRTENKHLRSEIKHLRSEIKNLRFAALRRSNWFYPLALKASGLPRPWFRLAFLNAAGLPRSFLKPLFYRKNGCPKKIFRQFLT